MFVPLPIRNTWEFNMTSFTERIANMPRDVALTLMRQVFPRGVPIEVIDPDEIKRIREHPGKVVISSSDGQFTGGLGCKKVLIGDACYDLLDDGSVYIYEEIK
jgi:hypothetical protein